MQDLNFTGVMAPIHKANENPHGNHAGRADIEANAEAELKLTPA